VIQASNQMTVESHHTSAARDHFEWNQTNDEHRAKNMQLLQFNKVVVSSQS